MVGTPGVELAIWRFALSMLGLGENHKSKKTTAPSLQGVEKGVESQNQRKLLIYIE